MCMSKGLLFNHNSDSVAFSYVTHDNNMMCCMV